MKQIILLVFVIPLLSLYGLFWLIDNNDLNSSPEVNLIETAKTENKLIVLSSFTILADMVSEIGGDKVLSLSLTKSGMNIHEYEPTPQDLTKAQAVDLFVVNGLDLESRIGKLLSSVPSVSVVTASKGVEIISIAEGSNEGKPNPHVWMSPKQSLTYVENIKQALINLRPEDRVYFEDRARIYSEKIREIDREFSIAVVSVEREKRVLVTCEGAFSYLARDYGFSEKYIWAVNDESDGSPRHIAKIIDDLKPKSIPTVFCESTFEPLVQKEIAKAIGANLGDVLYVDSLSYKTGGADTYLKLMKYTTSAIVSGLKK